MTSHTTTPHAVFARTLALVALWPMLLPAGAWAQSPTPNSASSGPARASIVDLALGADGKLHGTAMSPEGRPAAGEVAIARDGAVVASAKVDEAGAFTLGPVAPGPCELRLLGTAQPARLWTASAAPPKAPQELLLVTGEPVERGQNPIGRILLNPLVLGLIVGTAVAIPLSVHNGSSS